MTKSTIQAVEAETNYQQINLCRPRDGLVMIWIMDPSKKEEYMLFSKSLFITIAVYWGQEEHKTSNMYA